MIKKMMFKFLIVVALLLSGCATIKETSSGFVGYFTDSRILMVLGDERLDMLELNDRGQGLYESSLQKRLSGEKLTRQEVSTLKKVKKDMNLKLTIGKSVEDVPGIHCKTLELEVVFGKGEKVSGAGLACFDVRNPDDGWVRAKAK